jgi:hypothetical protein
MHPKSQKATRFSLFLYRKIVALYPPEFRRRFEEELIQFYQDQLQARCADRSLASIFSIWSVMLPDLLGSIFVEYFEKWRKTMKTPWLAAKAAAGLFLAGWMVFVILSFGQSVFNWPIRHPTYWLLGDSFSNLAYSLFAFALVIGPLLVMLVYLLPNMRVQSGMGEDLMFQIRVLRMGRVELAVIAVSGMISLLILAIFVATRVFGV